MVGTRLEETCGRHTAEGRTVAILRLLYISVENAPSQKSCLWKTFLAAPFAARERPFADILRPLFSKTGPITCLVRFLKGTEQLTVGSFWQHLP